LPSSPSSSSTPPSPQVQVTLHDCLNAFGAREQCDLLCMCV
jgi:hypothetical protein